MYEGLNQNQIPFESAEWFPELDGLQESGKMNMFGAPRWLQDTFGFSKEQAQTISLGEKHGQSANHEDEILLSLYTRCIH